MADFRLDPGNGKDLGSLKITFTQHARANLEQRGFRNFRSRKRFARVRSCLSMATIMSFSSMTSRAVFALWWTRQATHSSCGPR